MQQPSHLLEPSCELQTHHLFTNTEEHLREKSEEETAELVNSGIRDIRVSAKKSTATAETVEEWAAEETAERGTGKETAAPLRKLFERQRKQSYLTAK